MTPELEAKLQACPNLPSPPTIAVQIISLANDPEINFKRVIQVVNCDPALASKILRIANSPLYPYGKKVENLHQALMVLGVNATISLALSFSLTTSLKTATHSGLDYDLYWKRACMASTASQVLGDTCQVTEIEELRLAGLLQDLGMLALDQIFPDLYGSHTGQQSIHASLIKHEQHCLGVTHGAVGSWLLTQWNLPDRLRLAVNGSDDPARVPAQDERATFASCVCLSGMIAEIFLREADDVYLQNVKQLAQSLLQLEPQALMDILETVKERLPDTARIFETDLQTWNDPQTILDSARESLLARNLQALKQVEELRISNANMEAQFLSLEESHRYDPLTGTLNRAHLDKCLETSFERAVAHNECLTLIFGDLDKFKLVNDTYGHQAGDVVLQSTARLLLSLLRTTDMVGRFGGEEFVLILPKSETAGAKIVADRILTAFRNTAHEVDDQQNLTVTISLGIATHTPEKPYANFSDLLLHADEAVYFSKAHGGDQYTAFENIKAQQLA